MTVIFQTKDILCFCTDWYQFEEGHNGAIACCIACKGFISLNAHIFWMAATI